MTSTVGLKKEGVQGLYGNIITKDGRKKGFKIT